MPLHTAATWSCCNGLLTAVVQTRLHLWYDCAFTMYVILRMYKYSKQPNSSPCMFLLSLSFKYFCHYLLPVVSVFK